MATTVTMNEKNFDELTQKGIVLIDWWAGWCGPCRMFAPIFEGAARKHEDLIFGKIDTEAEPGLADTFGIRSIPTLMVFREGILVFSQPGILPARVLDELITDVKALDMVEVRRVVAQDTEKRTKAG